MKLITNFVRLIWRLWFIIVAGIPIIIFFPIIFLIIFFNLKKLFTWSKYIWASWILFWMGFQVKLLSQTKVDYNKSYIIIGNHTSVLDIIVLLKIFRSSFVFVGKKELSKLPVFGYLYKKTNILVDRSSLHSRKEVYNQAKHFIKKSYSIAFYPEGGIPDTDDLLAPFKNGAFRMAIEHQLPILPIVYYDNKKRYPYDLFKGSPGKLRVKILPIVQTKGLTLNDMEELRDFCYNLIYNELMNDKLSKNFQN